MKLPRKKYKIEVLFRWPSDDTKWYTWRRYETKKARDAAFKRITEKNEMPILKSIQSYRKSVP